MSRAPNSQPDAAHPRSKEEAAGDNRILLEHWEYAQSKPTDKIDVTETQQLEWMSARVPGTVAAQLLSAQPVDYDLSLPLDDNDYWYRTEFSVSSTGATEIVLHLQGLATLADVWLNTNLLLRSDNMFVGHVLSVTAHCAFPGTDNQLLLRFRALSPELEKKRPRARWRTPFVQHRNLRFIRTSLLGRTPGLLPLVPIVGPWRPVFLEVRDDPSLELKNLDIMIEDGKGLIEVVVEVRGARRSAQIDHLEFRCGDHSIELTEQAKSNDSQCRHGRLQIENPGLWFPHTCGTPTTYTASVHGRIDGRNISLQLERIGFRTIDLCDPFALSVNGRMIYCRGACWRPLAFPSMNPVGEHLREILELAVAAGLNMLRIPGETAYETDEFYQLCDELGIMVWQDFMFARLDYPVDEPEFLKSITNEVTQQLERLRLHPCLTLLCGNTEVAQQAAMLGLESEFWSNTWFDREVASLCASRIPGVPYYRSSPDGGEMPFYTESGVSHYFGVGAYTQELSDAVLNTPAFAAECLAFAIHPLANLAEGEVEQEDRDATPCVPKDALATRTFLDVTEHYVQSLYGVDLQKLKLSDVEFYNLLCGTAVGEVMYWVQCQWRRRSSRCAGSLLISFNDSIPGSGWGIIDSNGYPKAPYYYLKRAWKPLSLGIVDQTVNGLLLVLHNDQPAEFNGTIVLSFLRADGKPMHSGTVPANLPANGGAEIRAEQIIGHFLDSSYTYQFGELAFEYVLAELVDLQGRLVEECVLLSRQDQNLSRRPIGVDLEVVKQGDGRVLITLYSDSFVHSLTLTAAEAYFSDNCFHLLPHRPKQIVVRLPEANDTCRMLLQGLNMSNRITHTIAVGTTPLE